MGGRKPPCIGKQNSVPLRKDRMASRFFRDHFELEFYVRRLAKNGVRLVSITQEMGDDPMHVMMRQIMALFDEYQSKENAKHVLRALKENARQGFWNGPRRRSAIASSRQDETGCKGRSIPMEKLDNLVRSTSPTVCSSRNGSRRFWHRCWMARAERGTRLSPMS